MFDFVFWIVSFVIPPKVSLTNFTLYSYLLKCFVRTILFLFICILFASFIHNKQGSDRRNLVFINVTVRKINHLIPAYLLSVYHDIRHPIDCIFTRE